MERQRQSNGDLGQALKPHFLDRKVLCQGCMWCPAAFRCCRCQCHREMLWALRRKGREIAKGKESNGGFSTFSPSTKTPFLIFESEIKGFFARGGGSYFQGCDLKMVAAGANKAGKPTTTSSTVYTLVCQPRGATREFCPSCTAPLTGTDGMSLL